MVFLTSQGKPKEIPIGLDAFQHIIGLDGKMDFPSLEDIRRVLRQDLEEVKYTSREDIVAFVQDVKKEIAYGTCLKASPENER